MVAGRRLIPLVAFLAWTLFVWGGRIRNALADTALDAPERTRTIALAASFVVPALWLAVEAVVASLRRRPPARRASWGLAVLVVWTIAVWVVRAGDIVLGGDHDAGFVVVHVVLAVVSVALGAAAVAADRRRAAAGPTAPGAARPSTSVP